MNEFKIGTRSSAMAMAQTSEVAAQLKRCDQQISARIVKFQPRGDRDQTAKLDRHGGKGGAFVAEIRNALRSGELHAAMHSLKDVPGDEETPGLVFGAYLKREEVEDALVLRADKTKEEFIDGRGANFRIGTNSVRRAAYLKRLYPNTEIIHYRGAADTRIRKLDDRSMQKLPGGGEVGPADGLIMAASGLARVGLSDRITMTFSADDMLPAIGQGVVVVECAADDWRTRKTLLAIEDSAAKTCALAEREVLWILNGHCNTPIAGLARLQGDTLTLKAAVLSLDGETVIEAAGTSSADRPRELGREVGLSLLAQGAGPLIAATAPSI